MSNVLGTNALADLAGTLTDFFEKVAGPDGRIWLAEFKKFLRKESCWGVQPVNPDTFFQARPGLWVSEDFRRLVVAKAGSAGQVIATKTTTLQKGMTDTQIEKMLGGGHIFTEDQLCATLAGMIREQWGGKAGPLLNNGYANLFYTASCVVRVDWGAGDGGWGVGAWQRDGGEWGAGGRVFSPAGTS